VFSALLLPCSFGQNHAFGLHAQFDDAPAVIEFVAVSVPAIRQKRFEAQSAEREDSQDGLHITSMSGSWLAIAKGFAGMRTLGGLRLARGQPPCA